MKLFKKKKKVQPIKETPQKKTPKEQTKEYKQNNCIA